jgi:hypothetical protein
MRLHTWAVPLGAVGVSALLASACGEPAAGPTLAPARPRAVASPSASPGYAIRTYTIRVKKNGEIQRYQVRVDKHARTLDIASGVTAPAECDPDLPDACTNNGSPVDEQLDDGRIIVGNVAYSPNLPAAECPAYVDGGWWLRWRTHNFIIWGHWQRIKSLRVWPFGKAEYLIPAGPWESDDKKARIWSGVVLGSCYGGYERGEFRGIITSTWLRGDAEEAGTNPAGSWAGNSPPDDGEGATTVDTSSGTTTSGAWYTGDPEVDKVLKAFYENGTCTPGWLIFVNGAQVC